MIGRLLCCLLFVVLFTKSFTQSYSPDTIADRDTVLFAGEVAKDSITGFSGADMDSIIKDSVIVPVSDSIKPDTLTMLPDTLIPSLPRTDTLSLVMVGDVMLGTNFPSSEYLPPNDDCWPLLEPVANYIQDADISFCNLEGGFGTQGVSKKCRDPKTCYVFRMPDEYSSCLTRAGFDVVSVANNHVNDFGYEGRINTVRILNEAEIHFAGFSDHPYTIFTSNNFLIGFCAFSPNSGVQDLRDIAGAERIVKYLSDTCDIVLVSMHGGAEGANYQHVTRQKETFLGADRGNVYEFAHRMIDSGADVVIGHGPHVTRAMEVYKNRFIAYSLGNFATYARFNLSGPNGIAPLVRLNISPKGEFLDGIIIPIQQTGEGGASPDPEKKIISKLRSLNSLDFPEGQLKLDDSGILRTVISENTETD